MNQSIQQSNNFILPFDAQGCWTLTVQVNLCYCHYMCGFVVQVLGFECCIIHSQYHACLVCSVSCLILLVIIIGGG